MVKRCFWLPSGFSKSDGDGEVSLETVPVFLVDAGHLDGGDTVQDFDGLDLIAQRGGLEYCHLLAVDAEASVVARESFVRIWGS